MHGDNTYTYNVDGMLTATNSAQYVYDALNQRVAKTGGSNPTEIIYFLGNAIAFHNPSSGAYTDLIWAGGREIATVAGTQTATPTFRLLDHEGSLAMTTNASGTVTGSNVMSPYGETLSSTTSDPYAYAGLYQDTEYGGDAAWFRNYSAEQSRWTRPDPYNGSYDITNPQSMNRYVYALNNPLGITDPSGLDCVYDEGGGTVDVVSGDCYSSGDDGYYIDGTINTSSITLNPDGSLNFGITSPNGDVGVGSILGFAGGVSGTDSTDSGELNPFAQGVFQSGVFVGADKTVHGLAIATGVIAAPFAASAAASAAPYAAGTARVAGQLELELLLNPSTWTIVNDFASGATPASLYPPTYAAAAGVGGSWLWDYIHR